MKVFLIFSEGLKDCKISTEKEGHFEQGEI